MPAITNLSDKHVDDMKAGRSDRNLWIYGYDLSVDEEGPAVARLKKIIRGLRDLTMVDEEALSAHLHPVATVRQLEEVKGKIMFMLNRPASKALALKGGGGSACGGRRAARNSDVGMARTGYRAHERRQAGSSWSAGQIRRRPHHHVQTAVGKPQ